MSSNIDFLLYRSTLLQTGYGIPDHISLLGSSYLDLNTGIEYLNTDGVSSWVEKLTNSSTGATINGNISAQSLSDVNYIDFKTNPSVPSPTGGTLYFDSGENALSYKPITTNNDVTVNLGQESLIKVYNNTSNTILNGKAIHITGSTLGVPTIALASAASSASTTSSNVSGVATHDIPQNTYGFITNFGIVRDVNTTGFTAGDEIYLSDTIDGGYTNNPSSLKTSSRTSIIGWVITSSVNGKILVVPQNEDTTQTLTNKERNILLGDLTSTGLYYFTGITTSATTFNVSPVNGWVVSNTGSYSTAPKVIEVNYSGGTNIPVTNLATANNTFLLVTSGGTLIQQTTFPTSQQRRENIFLGKIIHPNRTVIQNANNLPDFSVSTMSALRDLWTPLRAINMGVQISANGANLSFNQSSGSIWGNGFGWITNSLTPNTVTLSAQTPATFQYRTQTGATTGNLTSIVPGSYDLNGVVTAVGGGANSSTNQRVYIFSTGVIRVQYGQQVYSSLADAVAGLQTESFVEFENNRDNGLLIGVISVNKNATALNDITKAIFHPISKFGEVTAGGAGGSSTTTLQQAYDNSTTPEITINSILDGLSIKNGTGNADNTTRLLEGLNSAGNATSFIRADGDISGTTLQTNGFTANTTGLSANTISATTYYNLPIDVNVTGGTFNTSAGTTTFTNSTGGTFTVTGQTKNLLLYGEYSGVTTYGSPSSTGLRTFALGDGARANATDIVSIGTLAGNGGSGLGNTLSNFIGFAAGYNASSSSGSNFMGSSAGLASTGSINSVMIGNNAGSGNNYSGGSFTTIAPNSIYIGNNAGRLNTVNFSGSNNIVIGNTIGVPSGTTNTLNIGGVMFADGLYSTTTGYTSTSAQTIGRVAINTYPQPNYALYVNGNFRTPNYGYFGVVVSSQIGVDTDISLLYGGTTGISTRRDPSTNYYSNTSGNQNLFTLSTPFLPTTGDATYNIFNVSTTINQTGGASGITRGLYINPTLTSAYDFRAIEVISGKTILQSVSATTITANTVSSTSLSGTSLIVKNTGLYGNGNYSKSLGSGDIALDNNSTDTPALLMYYGNNINWGIDSNNQTFNILSGQLLRFVNNLNESGGAVKMAMDTSGNLVTIGFVQPNAWRAGQVVQSFVLSTSDVTQLQQGGLNRMATDGFNRDVFYYSYTPLSSSSYIIVEVYLSKYDFGQGTGTDTYYSQLKATLTSNYSRDANGQNNGAGNTEIGYNWQGTRSSDSFRTGTLFPLVGRYTNSDTNAKVFSVSVRRDSADDYISYDWTTASFWMKITEVAR